MQELKGKIKCVVFDMDGTLFDSEKVWKDVSLLMNKKYKINIDDQMRLNFCGRATQEVIDILQEKFPYIDAKKVRQEWEKTVKQEIYDNGVEPKEGFSNLLEFLLGTDLKLGLATGSKIKDVEVYFKKTKYKPKEIFDEIITIDDVSVGKPSPEIYKIASKRLGVKSKNCLAIEDSPNGALSALKAGFNVILVPDAFKSSNEIIDKCCGCFNDLNEVKDFLKDLM